MHYKVSKLAVTNVEVAKNAASFLAQYNPWIVAFLMIVIANNL